MESGPHPLPLPTGLFHPGMRVAVACSGGADSVALLRTLLNRRAELGLILSVAHMNHGTRGGDSDADEAFVADVAASFDLPFHRRRVDAPATAVADGKGLEETARDLRYAWFWELLEAERADCLVTAHTLDDQAETVLHRLLRGAWTEGLGGIFPTLAPAAKPATKIKGFILRPFLTVTRSEIEAWLRALPQPWREDASNRDTAFTRNRLRHQTLPALAEYNPAIKRQLSQLAALARDEEAYWQGELARQLPSILLTGKAVRGGGRSTATLNAGQSLSIEIERLRALHPALRRRVLRAAAAQFAVALDFDQTERLLALCGLSSAGGAGTHLAKAKIQIEKDFRAERTPRELRLFRAEAETRPPGVDREYLIPIPGAVDARAFGLRLQARLGKPPDAPAPDAHLRASRPGDRVTLPHSRSPLKVREALRRLRLPLEGPHLLVEWQGEIVWLQGVAMQSKLADAAVLLLTALPLEGLPPACNPRSEPANG